MSILRKYTEKKMRWCSILYYSNFYIVLFPAQKMQEEEYAFGMHKTTQPPLYASFRKDFLCHLHRQKSAQEYLTVVTGS